MWTFLHPHEDVSRREEWSECTARRVEVIGRGMPHVTRQHYAALCSVGSWVICAQARTARLNPLKLWHTIERFIKLIKVSLPSLNPINIKFISHLKENTASHLKGSFGVYS